MKISNLHVYGLPESVAASGLPMVQAYSADREASAAAGIGAMECLDDFNIEEDSPKHLERAGRLASCQGGESHDCFLCGVVCQMTITAPRYWWPEFQRYHFADIVSSTSTMHTLKGILKDALDGRAGWLDELRSHFCGLTSNSAVLDFADFARNVLRDGVENAVEVLKANLPEGWLQTARVTTNYRQLKTIYRQRHNHRLKEWRDFCRVLETLPRREWITGVLP